MILGLHCLLLTDLLDNSVLGQCQIRVRPGGTDGSRQRNAGMGGTD